MEYTTKKIYKNYDFMSRYTKFPCYFHTLDNVYFYGLTNRLSTETPFTVHTVKQLDTLDSISLTYYGRPDLYWIIADFNRINDPYIKLHDHYETLNIPDLNSVEFK